MCEQTEVVYLPDEVVWVKLHQPSLWWPGQVQDYDKLPEEVTEGLRKKPIAIVKFFQEDTYEYVNNLNNIYRYNCSKKHDFIKKGLALARSKRPERISHMDLFPQDVVTAETLTHGDPNIIRDEEFAPEEKPSYERLFGTEKKKKPKSVVESILKERPSWRVKPLITSPSSTPKTPSSPKVSSPKVITHPRFINKALRGETDHKICIREQPVVEDETASPSSEYRCHSCDFVTARLNVIVLHYRSHSKSTTPIPSKTRLPKAKSTKSTVTKPAVTKPKPETPTKATPTEPPKKRNILRESSEEPPEKPSPKKSPKTQSPKPQAAKTPAPKRKAKTDVKPEVEGKRVKKEEIQELLKDWSDEEVEEESRVVGKASDDDADSKMEVEEAGEKPVKEDKVKEKSAPPAKSKAVFDFDDDDEGLDPKLTHNTRVFGRKIPRVIDNIKERKTSYPDSPPEPEDVKEAKKKKVGGRKTKVVAEPTGEADKDEGSEKQKETASKNAERMKELESMNAEIDSLLEKTSLPDLPEIPRLNAFSMDVTDDGVPIEKSKDEKDKSILREHNTISANAARENAEDGVQAGEPSKNSLPEVGSAVEKISTPPQAEHVKITAETRASKPASKSAVISSPQSTSGGDHSYVSDKRPPPASKMPPLVLASPKSTPGKSRTYILSPSSPGKSPTSQTPQAKVAVPPTSTKTTKPMPSLVRKDPKYVIVRTTQSGDVKVMPNLSPSLAGTTKFITQSQTGKKVVIVTKQPSGNVVLSSPKEAPPHRQTPSQNKANILSKAPPKTSMSKAKSSPVLVNPVVSTAPTPPRKAAETKSVTSPKQSLALFTPDATTYLVPVSKSSVFTTRSPGASKSVVLPQNIKLVSSKDNPGKLVFQMNSQKTKVQLPTMKRAVPAIRTPRDKCPADSSVKTTAVLSSPKPVTTAASLRTLTPLSSPKTLTLTSPKTLTPLTSPKTMTALTTPKTVTLISSKTLTPLTSPKTTAALTSKTLTPLTSPKILTALTSPTASTAVASPKTPGIVASPKPLTAVTSTKSLASPVVAKTPPKQTTNKFFHRDAPSLQPTRTLDKNQTAPIKKQVAVPGSTALAQTKMTPRGIVKLPVTSKTPKAPEAAVSSAPVGESASEGIASGSMVAAEGADGTSLMYILDNGTLISYDQVSQADSQGRTVYIDPASLSSSSGDLSNLIFTFDESAGNEGTVLSIAPQEREFTFAPGSGRPSGSSTQDILAEALANTQVLQAEASASEMILDSSSIATNTVPSSSALYPNTVLTLSNNVLETSLTLNAPIMTPLEVPSAVSSLQPPPAASGSLELPITVAQPDITISTSSYASLPIPSATIQGTVFSDSTTATYSTIVPVLAGDSDKQAFFVEAPEGATFELAEDDTAVFASSEAIASSETGDS